LKYISQNKLKAWRENQAPKKCPISQAEMHDNVVDHCHCTGEIRGVLHRQSNAFLGKVENAWKRYACRSANVSLPEALRRMADYIEFSCTGLLHPVGANQLQKKFERKKTEDQLNILLDLGVDVASIDASNSDKRSKLYRKQITKIGYEP
tara:strand:- start:86 stop:535 length:450 start_codon:yes stop_codon:yes gene_type:complete